MTYRDPTGGGYYPSAIEEGGTFLVSTRAAGGGITRWRREGDGWVPVASILARNLPVGHPIRVADEEDRAILERARRAEGRVLRQVLEDGRQFPVAGRRAFDQ